MTEEVLRVELDHLKADVGEIKERVAKIDDNLTQMRVDLAGQKVKVGMISGLVGAFVSALVAMFVNHR